MTFKTPLMGSVLAFLMTMGSASADPMGLTDYVISNLGPDGRTWVERRLTNHEVDLLKGTGQILPDGSVKQQSNDPSWAMGPSSQISKSPIVAPMAVPSPVPQAVPTPKPVPQAVPGRVPSAVPTPMPAHLAPAPNRQIVKKPKPNAHQIAKATNTKHPSHPLSKGTIQVRPTNMPANPTGQQIEQMQRHIQHIERSVGRALDLSLSAYAVAELPQATDGRSSLNVGMAAADGRVAEAIGFSSNFGHHNEYTVKISLSHAGHEEAVGAGFGWQW